MFPKPISADRQLSSRVNRLVVLIPVMDFTPVKLSKVITDLAGDQIHQVVYLAVPQNPDEEMSLASKLNHLYAATHSDRIHVEIQMQYGISWRKAIRGLMKPGDMVVCPEEGIVRWHVLWHKPLNDVLMNAINVPFYLMPFNNHTAPGYQGEEVKQKTALRGWNSNGHKKNNEK